MSKQQTILALYSWEDKTHHLEVTVDIPDEGFVEFWQFLPDELLPDEKIMMLAGTVMHNGQITLTEVSRHIIHLTIMPPKNNDKNKGR